MHGKLKAVYFDTFNYLSNSELLNYFVKITENIFVNPNVVLKVEIIYLKLIFIQNSGLKFLLITSNKLGETPLHLGMN